MAKRKKYTSPIDNKFHRQPYYTLESGRVIECGEIIKIQGEHGCKFKFLEHVINKETGADWIDCFEIRNGIISGWRSFRCEKIKPLPKRRNKKNVKVS